MKNFPEQREEVKQKSTDEAGKAYLRAWLLVQTMNRSFKLPLVLAAHGGPGGGGAELTVAGRRMLALYWQMEKQAAATTGAAWKKMQSQLKP